MKKAPMFFAVLTTLTVIALFIMGQVSKNGQAAGILDGRLTPCLDKPNCVCSEYREDVEHFIEPLEISGQAADEVNAVIRGVIREMGGEIATERADYIAATFRSSLFGFVDDLEIRIDPGKSLIQLRSASRVGYGDLGANQKRVEQFRRLFSQA